YRDWSDALSIVDGLEIAHVDIEDSQGSCTIINASNTLRANIHHNRIVDTGADDTAHCGAIFLTGSGAIHHNEVRNFWGNGARTWCLGTPGSTGIDIYNNLMIGSRKYSGVEVQAFEAVDEAGAPCQWRIANNTFGDLTALD